MKMLTDNPIYEIHDDRFGFKLYAQILADSIKETEKLPFCIGVFGQWGSGKTSLMKMIQENVRKNKFKTIWFNPWKYDKKEDLWHSLIQTILYQIAEEDNQEIANKAKNLAFQTSWLLFKKSLTSVMNNIITDDALESLKHAFLKQDELHFRHLNRFEKDFEDVVSLYTNSGKLVILIDDLDRCVPENAITVLESMKLFLGCSNCIFILGMDQRVIEEGIKHRYGDKIHLSGRDYLDKIIQLPFFLPPVSFPKLREFLEEFHSISYSSNIWKLVEIGLRGNPRLTKRFVNCFQLVTRILKESSLNNVNDINETHDYTKIKIDESLQSYYIAKLLIIQMLFPNFYSHLSLFPESWDLYEDNLINAQSLDDREIFLKNNMALRQFWNHDFLHSFMVKTSCSKSDFPEPPDKMIISSFIKMVNLVNLVNKEEQEKLSHIIDR